MWVWMVHLLLARPCCLLCRRHKEQDMGSYHFRVPWSISRTTTYNGFLNVQVYLFKGVTIIQKYPLSPPPPPPRRGRTPPIVGTRSLWTETRLKLRWVS